MKERVFPQRSEFDSLLRSMSNGKHDDVLGGTAMQLLAAAELAHPEHLCIKDVYGAMLVRFVNGREVTCLGRNGMVNGSPQHLEHYLPANLLSISEKIHNNDDTRKKLTRVLSQLVKSNPSTPVSCLALHMMSGAIECDKGFEWDKVKRATRSKSFCPNSLAGCTERMLLKWLPYLSELFDYVDGESKIVVQSMHFDDQSEPPEVNMICSNKLYENVRLQHISSDWKSTISQLSLVVQTVPCPTCAMELVKWHKSSLFDIHVYIRDLSQYKRNEVDPVQTIDMEDVGSLLKMDHHEIKLHFFDSNHPKVEFR